MKMYNFLGFWAFLSCASFSILTTSYHSMTYSTIYIQNKLELCNHQYVYSAYI